MTGFPPARERHVAVPRLSDLIRSRAARLTSLLGIEHAIVGGPMAGVTTPELVAAVSNAGGLGSLGCGMMEAAQVEAAIGRVRELTDRPFAVNLFVTPRPAADEAQVLRMQARLARYRAELGLPRGKLPSRFAPEFDEQFDAVLAARVPAFSFTFGALDAPRIGALRAQGAKVIGTASCAGEARQLAESGCDAVVASGVEAGGHRATFAVPFESAQVGLFALLPQVAAAVEVPVVAAGGVMTAGQVAAALLLGASGVQLGSALLRCPESGASAAYKEALAGIEDTGTRLTRAFSGRWARGVANRFMQEIDAAGDIPEYPIQNRLTQDIRAAANAQGRADCVSLWAGQAAGLATDEAAGDLVRRLQRELEALL
jgi:nitronate monooxygenase